MIIDYENMNRKNKAGFEEFRKEIEYNLNSYTRNDPKNLALIRKKIIEKQGNWDNKIQFVSPTKTREVDLSLLLAYEYCMAAEKLSNGQISFKEITDKLFNNVEKFRIGEPVKGLDDECLYGKAYDDFNSIPITSKKYRYNNPKTEAQMVNYVKNGEIKSAIFIFKKGNIEDFAKNHSGENVSLPVPGLDFSNSTTGQSLITNLRQSTFHEFNHVAEKDIISPVFNPMEYEYKGVDGKIYRNYDKVNQYVSIDGIENISEPEYFIEEEKDYDGEDQVAFINDRGHKYPIEDFGYPFKKVALEREICISQGLTTLEVLPSGQAKKQNALTEGFVEAIARDMVRVVDPNVKDLDESRYPEYVEIANHVIEARDRATTMGKTYLDFLLNSAELKKDLESRVVKSPYGTKVDGLHYLSNYAEQVRTGDTRKRAFFQSTNKIFAILGLPKEQIQRLKESKVFLKKEFSETEKDTLTSVLIGRNPYNEGYAKEVVAYYMDILEEEKEFYSSIGDKLGYRVKNRLFKKGPKKESKTRDFD